MVRLTTASITADLYEWTPHDPKRILRQETNPASSGDWERIELTFSTTDWDPFMDFRLRCVGEGTAFFDDIHIRKIAGESRTLPPSYRILKATD